MPGCNTALHNRLQRVLPCKCNYTAHATKTAHRALQRLFLRLRLFNRPRYQTDTSGYNTTCATLEGIHAPGRAPAILRYHRHAGTLYRSTQPPIVIRYIIGRGVPVIDPCQTVQHIIDHASGGGVSMLSTPGGWRSGTGSAVRAGSLAPSTRWGSPAAGSAAGGAKPLAATAAFLFGLSPDS